MDVVTAATSSIAVEGLAKHGHVFEERDHVFLSYRIAQPWRIDSFDGSDYSH